MVKKVSLMHKQTLWYEIYTGRKINREIFDKYFGKNGDDETWYIYYVENNGEPPFELHAHIDGEVVVSADTFKADVYAGHGKPIIDEKNLTSSEKKYAIEIFDQCFVDRVGGDLNKIIEKAIAIQAEYDGYKATKQCNNYVLFISEDGKKTKLQNKKLLQALDYSHIDLAVLRDSDIAKQFAQCVGMKVFEPLFAILQIVNPTDYPEYEELERKYRYEKMQKAVESGSVENCSKYVDVLKNSKNNIEPFCSLAIELNNEELLKWLIDNTEEAYCNLCSIMGIAIKKDKEELFYYLLDSELYDASTSDSTKWNSPIYAATYSKGREKYVMPLLKKGFTLSAKIAYRLYSTYSLDELAELLPYKVMFDKNTVKRIYIEGREDIICELEKRPLKYCDEDILFEAYVHSGDFSKFSATLENGYKNESVDLFEKAYEHSTDWTDLWIRHGFDVNCNQTKLLHDACKDLKVDFAIYLLENGANPHIREKYSGTVFENAGGFHGYLGEQQEKEKQRLCKYLMSIGLSPIEESRRSPSLLAYMMGKSEEFDIFLIDWLAEHNCINSPDTSKEDTGIKHLPISHVLGIFKYNPRMLRYFIEKGACLNAQGITDEKLFLEACRCCDLPELQLVVSAGANIHEIERDGTNALFVAVDSRRNEDVIRYLVDLGIDVNSIRPARPKCVGSSIIEPEASILDVAEKNADIEIVEYLKNCGALHAHEIINI